MKFCWQQNKPLICAAPLHSITNSAQRQIFKSAGADVVFSEMVSSMGLNYSNQKTLHKTKFSLKEKPIIIQIFGNTLAETIAAGQLAERLGADGVDFNCGCPAKSMVASGNGGQLLLEPQKLIKILSEIKKNIKIPLSLKTRIGYDKILPAEFYLELADQSGIDCLILHGRTVKQMYRGGSNWDHLKSIAQKIKIPLIGNGDITDPYIALDRLENYTPAGIMIGRAALGNPWIFSQIKKLRAGHKINIRHNLATVVKTARRHTKLCLREFMNNQHYRTKFSLSEIEQHAIHNMRKHYAWYIKDFPQAKSFRLELFRCNSVSDVESVFTKILAL